MTELEALKLVCEMASDDMRIRIYDNEEYDLDDEQEAISVIEKMIADKER